MRQHRILLAMATVRPGHGHGTSWPPLARVCSRAYADRVLRRRVLPVTLDCRGGLSALLGGAACPWLRLGPGRCLMRWGDHGDSVVDRGRSRAALGVSHGSPVA